jgi:hypothetical protein
MVPALFAAATTVWIVLAVHIEVRYIEALLGEPYRPANTDVHPCLSDETSEVM